MLGRIPLSLKSLGSDPGTWRVAVIALDCDRLVMHLEHMRSAAACPVCGMRSRRAHRSYHRKPWDVPWGRWPVHLRVHARRFCCDVPTCVRRILVEPFPRVLARYAHRTERLPQVLLELAHGSHAESAARLARWLGYVTSPDTLIRRQRAERISVSEPRVVDLERYQPVAVLGGRT